MSHLSPNMTTLLSEGHHRVRASWSFIISNYHSFAFDQFALRAVITLSVLINTIINNSATQVPYFPYSFQ